MVIATLSIRFRRRERLAIISSAATRLLDLSISPFLHFSVSHGSAMMIEIRARTKRKSQSRIIFARVEPTTTTTTSRAIDRAVKTAGKLLPRVVRARSNGRLFAR